MKKNMTYIITLASFTVLMQTSVIAETNGKKVKIKELPNGNTLTVKKHGKIDDEGNIYKHRRFKVEDPEGDLVRRGKDKSVKYADGGQKRKQTRQIHLEDGSVIQKRRRGMTDGEGNQQGQAQRRRINADGEVVARQRTRGKNHADGSKVRHKQSQKKLADGSIGEKRVHKKKSANGNKTKVVRYRKKG